MDRIKRQFPVLSTIPMDILLGYSLLGILAIVVPYIFVWTYILPFAPPDAIIRRIFPSQYMALLILTLCFVATILFVGAFAVGLFVYEKYFKEEKRKREEEWRKVR
uniref:Dolichol phosphate-mannose biosynthesis regulatory protein n=1 Tax=Parascaris univalens TaxID=6257 RepID=A0A914ZDQ4_PARUN